MFGTQVAGTQPVYKLYNRNSGVHVYTITRAERDAILATYPTIFEEHTLLGYAYPVDADNIVIGAISQTSVAAALAAAAMPSAAEDGSTAAPNRTLAAPAVMLSRIAVPERSPAAVPAPTTESDMQPVARRVPAEPPAASIPPTATDAIFAGGLADDLLDL